MIVTLFYYYKYLYIFYDIFRYFITIFTSKFLDKILKEGILLFAILEEIKDTFWLAKAGFRLLLKEYGNPGIALFLGLFRIKADIPGLPSFKALYKDYYSYLEVVNVHHILILLRILLQNEIVWKGYLA